MSTWNHGSVTASTLLLSTNYHGTASQLLFFTLGLHGDVERKIDEVRRTTLIANNYSEITFFKADTNWYFFVISKTEAFLSNEIYFTSLFGTSCLQNIGMMCL